MNSVKLLLASWKSNLVYQTTCRKLKRSQTLIIQSQEVSVWTTKPDVSFTLCNLIWNELFKVDNSSDKEFLMKACWGPNTGSKRTPSIGPLSFLQQLLLTTSQAVPKKTLMWTNWQVSMRKINERERLVNEKCYFYCFDVPHPHKHTA